jgi:hypothetical protein
MEQDDMSGTTTNLALRYPTSGDNVAPLETYFANLANDTDAAVMARTAWTEDVETVNSGTTSGTTELVVHTIVAPLVTGGRYRVTHHAAWSRTVATDIFLHRIREDSIAGTAFIDYRLPAAGTTVPTGWHQQGLYTASATGDKTFVLTTVRQSGTGTETMIGSSPSTPAVFTVERVA